MLFGENFSISLARNKQPITTNPIKSNNKCIIYVNWKIGKFPIFTMVLTSIEANEFPRWWISMEISHFPHMTTATTTNNRPLPFRSLRLHHHYSAPFPPHALCFFAFIAIIAIIIELLFRFFSFPLSIINQLYYLKNVVSDVLSNGNLTQNFTQNQCPSIAMEIHSFPSKWKLLHVYIVTEEFALNCKFPWQFKRKLFPRFFGKLWALYFPSKRMICEENHRKSQGSKSHSTHHYSSSFPSFSSSSSSTSFPCHLLLLLFSAFLWS